MLTASSTWFQPENNVTQLRMSGQAFCASQPVFSLDPLLLGEIAGGHGVGFWEK
jgi:hypothetical protein